MSSLSSLQSAYNCWIHFSWLLVIYMRLYRRNLFRSFFHHNGSWQGTSQFLQVVILSHPLSNPGIKPPNSHNASQDYHPAEATKSHTKHSTKKPQVQSWSICFTLFLWQCQSFEVIFYSNKVDFHFFASYGRTTSLFSYNESRRKQDLDNNTSLTHFSSLAVLLLFSLSVLTALKTQLYFQLSSTTETSQVRPKTVKAVALRLSTWKSFSVTLSLSALWH